MKSIVQGALRLKEASPKGRFIQGMHCTRVQKIQDETFGTHRHVNMNIHPLYHLKNGIKRQQQLNYKNTSPPAYNLKHTVQDRVKLVITHHEPAMCAKIFFSWLVFT